MQNNWALQSATSHFLGQNFAKAFDVQYQTNESTKEYVWATSVSTYVDIDSHSKYSYVLTKGRI